MAIFKNRGGLHSHKANVGSLRVGVSDGDLVHQALLGRNCKIVLLSDFFQNQNDNIKNLSLFK